MICITDFLAHIRLTMKLQEQMLKNICETWQLTITEGKVISFLYNNPGKDTAADITELRMLSKGNVSQAVESLIQKGPFIPASPDCRHYSCHLFHAGKSLQPDLLRSV